MARKKAPVAPPMDAEARAREMEREVADAAAQEARERAKRKREGNAEKQKRFRERMKREGYRETKIWALPCPADVRERMTEAGYIQAPAWERIGKYSTADERRRADGVKVAVLVNESTIGAADRSPEVKAAVRAASYELWKASEKNPALKDIVHDVDRFLRVLGDWTGD